MLRSLWLRNLLSFGSNAEPVELGRLNVLIGANGSGKSNVLEAIALLQSAPRELAVPVREGGGVRDWLWKGAKGIPNAVIEAVVDYPRGRMPLRYRLSFTEVAQRLSVIDERIENERALPGKQRPYFYFGYEEGRPMLNVLGEHRELMREDVNPQQSVLAQRKDPEHYPEITFLGAEFAAIRIFREWNFGRYTPPRLPQPADLPNDFLSEDAANLGLVINQLRSEVEVRPALLAQLREVYEGVSDVDVNVQGGTVQLFLHENRWTIPATRLSDGTLRWLSLLAVLLHPSPPSVICIEEPEIGLHPDLIPRIAKLLVESSERTQLIVTTHSDVLVDALTDMPDTIVVVERSEGSSSLRRLDRGSLAAWLEKYSLGELWRKGEIGANRY